jgi:hypothetical protein
MKIKRHHFYTLLLTIIMMITAVALLFMNEWLSKHIEPKVEVREVHIAAVTPPPPSPPAQQVQAPEQSVTLSLEGDGPTINISKIVIEQPKAHLTPQPINTEMNVDFSNALTIDWQAFSIGDLDSIPTLLTQTKSTYPKDLIKQGILKVVIKLDIFIDELGKPTLISVSGEYYTELTSIITKLIKHSRFSPPTKNGKSVAARFVWPVEFKKT